MRLKLWLFSLCAITALSMNSYAYEVWHTPSGKSYEIHSSIKVGKNGEKHGFYIVSYRTNQHLDDRYGLLLEYYDLMTQLYHFHLPSEMKNDKHSVVTIEAFREVPKSKKDKSPSRRFTKQLSELKKLVDNHRKTDTNRLAAFTGFNARDYKAAITHFNKIKDKVPHDYYQMANAYLLMGDRDNAKKQLEAGIQKYPNDITLLNNLAMTTLLKGTYVIEGKYEYDPQQITAAKQILSKAIALDKDNWLTKSNMAVLETTAQQYKAAETLYLEALSASGESAELHYRVGSFYHTQKEFVKAEKHYQQALKKLSALRTPASQKRVEDIETRLKMVTQKQTPQ